MCSLVGENRRQVKLLGDYRSEGFCLHHSIVSVFLVFAFLRFFQPTITRTGHGSTFFESIKFFLRLEGLFNHDFQSIAFV